MRRPTSEAPRRAETVRERQVTETPPIPDLLTHKQTHFVLWRPGSSGPPPRLVIGRATPGANGGFTELANRQMAQTDGAPEVWEVPAAELNLSDGVYHYWFLVKSTDPYEAREVVLHRTDPHAFATDWRVLCDEAPAAVIALRDGVLGLCDADGSAPTLAADVRVDALPGNAALVLYQVPIAWTRGSMPVTAESVGVGTYADVRRLVDGTGPGPRCAPPRRRGYTRIAP